MASETWDFDLQHSTVGFWVRHLMVTKVRGGFTSWRGTLFVDEDAPEKSRVEVEIDAASIDTGDEKRDAHLKSAEFLDVDKHPTITFKSKKVEKPGQDRFRVEGELTVRGTTRPVALDVEYAGRAKDPWGGERAGFSAAAAVDRKDFGLNWNVALEAGGVLVGDRVNVVIEVEAVKAAAGANAAA